MSTAVELIAAEQERARTEEGYTPEHDVGHAVELVWAGRCYAEETAMRLNRKPTMLPGAEWLSAPDFQDFPWPWAPRYWKPTGDPVRDLVKAGSLIASAIDSLLAEQAAPSSPNSGEGE